MLRFLLGAMLGAALGAGAVWLDAQRVLNAPSAAGALVEVAPGAGLKDVARTLAANGLAPGRARLYLVLYARLTRQDRDLKSGEFEVPAGRTPIEVLAQIVAGRTKQYALTFIEGWRFEQALQALRANPAVRHTLADDRPQTAMAALGHPDLSGEGHLLPDTYLFPRGTPDVTLLREAYAAMDAALAQEWEGRDAQLPYGAPIDALTMASIVEKETGAVGERPQIAGVFVRRLRKHMKLQTDPTVIYGLGAAYDGNLRRRDLLRDTPYNSYTRYGLPPTPICLPGRAALHAALHPAGGDALYFVSRGDGTHYFSATLAEHAAAVRKYQILPNRHRS